MARSAAAKETQMNNDIQRMVEYIEQDGLEKVEEINLKSEEEFILEKNRLRDKEKIVISQHYDKLEDKANKDLQAEICRIKHRARLAVLNANQEVLNEIQKTAKERLSNVHCDDNKDAYKKVLTALILQGIFKLLESSVTIRYHQKDDGCIDDCINKATDSYKDKMDKDIEINKSSEYLPDKCIGGIILISNNNRITVDNTLEARMYIVAEKPDSAVLPQFRLMLFGANPNRKHFD